MDSVAEGRNAVDAGVVVVGVDLDRMAVGCHPDAAVDIAGVAVVVASFGRGNHWNPNN